MRPFLLTLALLLTINKDVNAVPAAGVSVKAENGSPIVASWKDGRKATFLIKEAPIDEVSFGYKIEENACNNFVGQNCRLLFKVRLIQIELVWSEHPDRGKIGMVLNDPTSNRKFLGRSYYNFANVMFDPGKLEDGRPVLRCNDYSWIPGGRREAPPDDWTVLQWATEDLRINNETQAYENQTNTGGFGLNFKRNMEGELELESVQSIFVSKQKVYMLFFAFLADIVHLVVKDEEKGLCQISLKGDIPNFSIDLERYGLKTASKGRPYIHGEDPALFNTSLMYIQKSMNEILQDLPETSVE